MLSLESSQRDAAIPLAEGADDAAHRELIAALYKDLRRIACMYFSQQPADHTLQPTALVHEAMLRILREENEGAAAPRWTSPGHFLAVAATAMRQILVDYARAAGAQKRGGDLRRTLLDPGILAPARRAVDVLELDEAIRRLSAVDDRAGRVVILRFFAGLTIAQTAEAMGVSDFTVERDWRFARAFLARELAGRPLDRPPVKPPAVGDGAHEH